MANTRRVIGGAALRSKVDRGSRLLNARGLTSEQEDTRLKKVDAYAQRAGASRADASQAGAPQAGWKTRLAREKMASAERINAVTSDTLARGQDINADTSLATSALNASTSKYNTDKVTETSKTNQGLVSKTSSNNVNSNIVASAKLANLNRVADADQQALRISATKDSRAQVAQYASRASQQQFAEDFTLAGGEGGNQIDPFSGVDYSGLQVPQESKKPNTKIYTGSLSPKGPKPGLVDMSTGILRPFTPPDDDEKRLQVLRAKNKANEYKYGN